MIFIETLKSNLKKKYFKKTLVMYSTITWLAIIAVSVGLMYGINRTLSNSIYKTQRTLLNQVKSMSDTYIVNQVNTIITQYFVDIRRDSIWNYFFTVNSSAEADMNKLYTTYQNITALKMNYDFIDSIVAYNVNSHIAVSSLTGVVLADTWQDVLTQHNLDLNLIDQLAKSKQSKMWVSPAENANNFKDTSMITFMQAIPVMRTGEGMNGCILININSEKFLNYINSFSKSEDTQLMIMDKSGRIFAKSNATDTNEDFSWLHKMVLSGNSGANRSNFALNKSSVIWTTSSVNDWIYISISPMQILYKDLLLTYQLTLWITIFILCITIISIHFATVWLHRPISTILSQVVRHFSNKDSTDEMETIGSAITDLSIRVEDVESVLKENHSLIKNQVVLDILNGNISDLNEVQSSLSVINMTFEYRYFLLVFAELDNTVIREITIEKREFLLYKMFDVFSRIFEQNGCCLSIRHNNKIVSIIGSNQSEYADCIQSITAIFRSQLGVNVNLGICKMTKDIRKLSDYFQNMDVFMQYSFIYGYGNVFTNQDIERYEASDKEISHNIFKDVETNLKAVKINDIKEILQKTIEAIRENGYSYKYTQSILMQIISILCRVIKEQNILTDELSKAKIVYEFNRANTLDEFFMWISKLLDSYSQQIQVRSVAIDQQFIQNIAVYIVEHIAEPLTLISVAKKFNISSSYLSRTFKEGLGVNFSVFLNSQKFNKAAELLLDSKNINVTEIANMLGYFNMPYFIQQFKEKFGMTPLQYRKANMNLHINEN